MSEYTKAVRIDDEEETTEKVVNNKKKKNSKSKKKKKAKRRVNFFVIFVLIICLIPCIFVAYILVEAMKVSNVPINGERFSNDLNPAISETMQENIKKDIMQIDGVENVSISLTTATLRVLVDINDLFEVEDALRISEEAVKAIDDNASIDVYFTSNGIKKMYDFEVNVYDQLGEDVSPTINVSAVRNASTNNTVTQVLSNPKNPEKVAEIEEERYKKEHPEEDEATSSDVEETSENKE